MVKCTGAVVRQREGETRGIVSGLVREIYLEVVYSCGEEA